jgi:hypothetical protein
MDNTFDALTKSFDKIFVTTAQNILGSDIKFCKWSFLFTSIGVGLSMLINSFYLIKINNENNSIKNKLNLLLNNQKLIIEGNITIYDFIKNTDVINNNKNIQLQLKNNEEKEDYDFLYCN